MARYGSSSLDLRTFEGEVTCLDDSLLAQRVPTAQAPVTSHQARSRPIARDRLKRSTVVSPLQRRNTSNDIFVTLPAPLLY